MNENITSFEMNGAKIGHYRMSSVEAAMIDVIFNAGSEFEQGTNWGALHLLEHMLFTKSRMFSDSHALEIFKEENGIVSNGWTSSMNMGFWFKFPYIGYKEAMLMMENILFYSDFTEKNLAREKSIIEQEYLDTYSSPYKRFYRAMRQQIYGSAHPYSRDAIGQPDFVGQQSLDDIRKLYRSFLVPANMSIGTAGKFSSTKVKTAFKHCLSKVNKGKNHKVIESVPQPETTYLWHKEEVENVDLTLVWMLPGKSALGLENILKLKMASYLFGGSPRSKLYKRLRHDLGLVYSTSSTFSWRENISTFDINASTSLKNLDAVYKEIRSLFFEFIDTPIQSDILERAKKYLSTQIMMSYDSVGNIASNFSASLNSHGRIITVDEYTEIINGSLENEIRELLNANIKETDTHFTSVLSKEDPHLDSLAS